jgi:Tetracyclin repressor-like, C-terminal domain
MNATPFGSGQDFDQVGTVAKVYEEFATDHPARFEVMSRRTLFRSENPRIRAAEDRLFLALALLVAASQRDGRRTDEDVRTLAAVAWSLAHGYCALRVQGTFDRQFFSTPPPTVEQLTAALVC